MLVPGTSVKPVESGSPGALESIVGGEGIKAQWQSLWDKDRTQLAKDLVATQIFDHALAGDVLAQGFSTGPHRPWPTPSTTSLLCSTARFLRWAAVSACTLPYGNRH